MHTAQVQSSQLQLQVGTSTPAPVASPLHHQPVQGRYQLLGQMDQQPLVRQLQL